MYKPIVFMFSGQGSQFYNMGKELFKHNAVFKDWMLELDEHAYNVCKRSIVEHVYDDNKTMRDELNNILYSHPAIFMIEYALCQVLQNENIRPDYVLGTSLGEFASAAVAGVISYKDALEAVIHQAEVIQSNCREGGMLAIIGDPDLYQDESMIMLNSELAGINFDSHFVVSGSVDQLRLISGYLQSKKIDSQLLPVTRAFHSSLIKPAEHDYKQYLENIVLSKPAIPMISCSRGEIVGQVSHDYFWEVVEKEILFKETIQNLEECNDCVYIDLGPAGTLATFIKYILNDSTSKHFSILTFFGNDLKGLHSVIDYVEEYEKNQIETIA